MIRYAEIIPDGMLVFFPSYASLEDYMNLWTKTTILSKLETFKPLFKEERNSSSQDFSNTIQSYRKAVVQSSRGAVFFGVCRGKISEGIDFADRDGRAVILTGIPYPSLVSSRVKMKRGYMDSQAKQHKNRLNGNDWYSQQAIRAVNQAVGRVIRHKKDYGAILLCDERFAFSSFRNGISKWIRGLVKVKSSFNESCQDIQKFFKTCRTLPVKNAHPSIYELSTRTTSLLGTDSRFNFQDTRNLSPVSSLSAREHVIQSTNAKRPKLLSLLESSDGASSSSKSCSSSNALSSLSERLASRKPVCSPEKQTDESGLFQEASSKFYLKLICNCNALQKKVFQNQILKHISCFLDSPQVFEKDKFVEDVNTYFLAPNIAELRQAFIKILPAALRKYFHSQVQTSSSTENLNFHQLLDSHLTNDKKKSFKQFLRNLKSISSKDSETLISAFQELKSCFGEDSLLYHEFLPFVPVKHQQVYKALFM